MCERLIDLMLAGANIKLPSMPRARDNTPRQISLSQWATLVRANAIQREELTIDVKQRNHAITGDEFGRTSRRAFANGSHSNPVAHCVHSSCRSLSRLAPLPRLTFPAAVNPPVLLGIRPHKLL